MPPDDARAPSAARVRGCRAIAPSTTRTPPAILADAEVQFIDGPLAA